MFSDISLQRFFHYLFKKKKEKAFTISVFSEEPNFLENVSFEFVMVGFINIPHCKMV